MSPKAAPRTARGQGACPSPLNATPALVGAVLDSAPLPARCSGRGLRPHPAAGCWGTLWRLGPPAPDGSPRTHSIGLGANAPAWTACGLALVPARDAVRLPYVCALTLRLRTSGLQVTHDMRRA